MSKKDKDYKKIIDQDNQIVQINVDKKESKNQEEKTVVPTRKSGATSVCFEWAQAIIPSLAIIVLVLTFGFRIVYVDGASMENTLKNEDRLFVTNFMYTPQNGDVVIISHGQEYEEPIVKRVIATEGQSIRVDYKKDIVSVDGVVLDEPYIKEADMVASVSNIANNSLKVPKGMVFVMGDNRNHSLDSRSEEVGLIAKTDIIGKAEAIVFPFNSFSYLY